VSPTVESLSVCLGAVSAIRSLVSVQESFGPQVAPSVLPCSEPWQHSALTLISGVTTIVFAMAGGTRTALVTSAVILSAGALFTLVVQAHLKGARR
jgi:hypothetical protein